MIGTGWWATQFHLPAIASHVAAIADPDSAKLNAAGEAFGIERRFTDHREMLGVVDGAVISVPHVHHYEIARDALDAGVHVMIEKPMTLRSDHAWDLVQRAAARRLHIVTGYTFQYTRHARRVHEIVRSGRIGELRLVSVHFASMVESFYRGRPDDYAETIGFPLTGPGPGTYSTLASGGGQLYTQVTHPVGMVFWVTGERAVEVHAYAERFDLEVDLADAIAFRLNGGAVGTVASTGSVRPGQDQQQDIRYYGSRGLIVQDLYHGRLSVHYNDGGEESHADLTEDEAYPAHATARCLVDLISGEGENMSPPEPAAVAVEFIEAAHRSASEGRPVELGRI